MKIAICDDEARDREQIKHYINTHSTKHEIIEFNSAIPLLKSIYAHEHFDVLFLDIQMPDSDGWEIAEKLKKTKTNIYIAMVTINNNYIYDCFDRVDWFTPKPVTKAKIHKVLNNAYETLFPIIFKFVFGKIPVALTAPEIVYFEVKRNDVFIHTVDYIYKIRESLHNINKQFYTQGFASPHQSFLLNLDHFESIENNMIILKSGGQIPLSRGKSSQFYNELREYVIRRKSNV